MSQTPNDEGRYQSLPRVLAEARSLSGPRAPSDVSLLIETGTDLGSYAGRRRKTAMAARKQRLLIA